MTRESTFEDWLASTPLCIRQLAEEFPLSTRIVGVDGRRLYVTGYTEGDELILSAIDPAEDYQASVDSQVPVPASELRAARKKTAN